MIYLKLETSLEQCQNKFMAIEIMALSILDLTKLLCRRLNDFAAVMYRFFLSYISYSLAYFSVAACSYNIFLRLETYLEDRESK